MIAYFLRHTKDLKRSPTHSTNQRSQLTSNQTKIAYFLRHTKDLKRLLLTSLGVYKLWITFHSLLSEKIGLTIAA